MKKNTAIVGIITASVLGSLSAHASFFDDNVSPVESATAIAKCSDEAKQLLSDSGTYLLSVTGKSTKDPSHSRVTTKRFTLQAGLNRGPFAPPALSSTLYADAKVTQPDPLMMDAPAKVEWFCTLEESSQ